MGRRALSIILSAIMIIGMLPTMAWAADYGDTQDHWAEGAIDRWSGYGVVNGKTSNTFDPEAEMTRAEAAQVFANLLGLNKEADLSAYADAQGDWFTSALAKCVAAGILNGKGEGKMDPNGTITREEFLTMYARAVSIGSGKSAEEAKANMSENGFADAENISDWAAEAVNTLVELGFVNGLTETSIAPQANINRASVMALLDQSISTYVGKDSTETTVTAKSEGITLIANPAVTSVTGTADVVVVAAGAEQYDETTGEITHNDIRVESAKMPVARVQGENITVTLAVNTEAEDAEVTATAEKSEIVVDSTAKVEKLTVSAESAKATVSGKVESITVAETAKNAAVETKANSTVGTLNVAAEDAKTTVAGKVETVKVEETAKNAAVETKANSTVGTLNVAAEDAKTTVAGKVETVKVEETAKNVAVETKSTAKVETVENKAENTSVTGTGSVGAVKSSEDVKIETKNTKVENTNESKEIAVTDSKGTETKVDSGSTGQTTPSAPTGDSHSHSYATEWTYDATDHWHAATCGHDVVSGKAAHSYNETTHRCECGAFDASVVAAIGDQGYETLKDAIAATPEGSYSSTATTITLLKDTNGGYDIDKGRSVVLDLNKKTLTLGPAIGSTGTETNGMRVLYGNKLTLKNGTIKCSDISNDAGKKVKIGLANYDTAVLEDVDFQSGTYVIGTINNEGNLTLKGNTTIGEYQNNDETDNPSYPRAAILNWPYQYARNGEDSVLIISDSKVVVGTIYVDKDGNIGNTEAFMQTGKAIINISAGTVKSVTSGGTHAMAEYNITGGTFSSDPSAYVKTGYAATKNTEANTWTVAECTNHTGGTYTMAADKHSFTCSECKKVVEGAHTFGENGVCTVCGYKTDAKLLEENPAFTCRIGNTGYETLTQYGNYPFKKVGAIYNAKSGDTIKMIADFDLTKIQGYSQYVATTKTNDFELTLDLNGKTITVPTKIQLTVGKYNIVDTSEQGNGKISRLDLNNSQNSLNTITVNVYGGTFDKIATDGDHGDKTLNIYGGTIKMVEVQGSDKAGPEYTPEHRDAIDKVNINGGSVQYVSFWNSRLNSDVLKLTWGDGYSLGTEITGDEETEIQSYPDNYKTYPVIIANE